MSIILLPILWTNGMRFTPKLYFPFISAELQKSFYHLKVLSLGDAETTTPKGGFNHSSTFISNLAISNFWYTRISIFFFWFI
jgi:hypothetical protein